jgi:hypothetical protein
MDSPHDFSSNLLSALNELGVFFICIYLKPEISFCYDEFVVVDVPVCEYTN